MLSDYILDNLSYFLKYLSSHRKNEEKSDFILVFFELDLFRVIQSLADNAILNSIIYNGF